MRRAVLRVMPCVTSQTKKSIKSRLVARSSPFGGMSFVAIFPQLIAGIAQENWYFIDSVPVVLFDPAQTQKRAYLTVQVKKDLKEKRAAPKAKDADGQRRGMKVNVNMAWGPDALVGGTAIICDHGPVEGKRRGFRRDCQNWGARCRHDIANPSAGSARRARRIQ